MNRANRWLQPVIGIAILTALVIYAEPAEVARTIMSADAGFLALVCLFLVLSTLLGGINQNLIVSRDGELSMSQFLPLYWVSWAFSQVVPGQIGDMVSLSALLRRHGFDWSASLGRTLIDKLTSFSVMALLGLIGVSIYMDAVWDTSTLVVIGIAAVLLPIAMLVVLGRIDQGTNSLLARIKRGLINTLREAWSTAGRYPGRVSVNFLLTWIKVGLIGMAFWAMFTSLGIEALNFHELLPLVAAGALVAYLPLSFNGLGTVEAAAVILLSSIGLTEPVVVSAYLVLRMLNILLAWIPTSLWLVRNRASVQPPGPE